MAEAKYWVAWRRKGRTIGFFTGPFWDNDAANAETFKIKQQLGEIMNHDFSPWFIADTEEEAARRGATQLGGDPSVTEMEYEVTRHRYPIVLAEK